MSIRDLIFEGKKARVAAGVLGGTMAAGGGLAHVSGKMVEEEAEKRLNQIRQSLGGKLFGKGLGIDPADLTDEGKKLQALKAGGKLAREVGGYGGLAGAGILGAAIVASLLAKKNEKNKNLMNK